MISEQDAGMPSGFPAMKKHKPTRRGRGGKSHGKGGDPSASLTAAHEALDRGDLEGAKRLALAAVNALHRSSHTHADVEPVAPKPTLALAKPDAKPDARAKLASALKGMKKS